MALGKFAGGVVTNESFKAYATVNYRQQLVDYLALSCARIAKQK
jgi:hypothetical protein